MSQIADIHTKLLEAIDEPLARNQIARMIELCIRAVQGVDSLDQKMYQRSVDSPGDSFSGSVLCVLSDEQREEFTDELADLGGRGVTLVHENDPKVGLARVLDTKPLFIIVGLEVDYMEGLEFVALLARKYPNSSCSVLVLPNKGDPFPPVLQSQDTNTGKNKTENISVAMVWDTIASRAQELQKQGRTGEKGPLGGQELASLAVTTLGGVRELASFLKSMDASLDDGKGAAGDENLDFDLDANLENDGDDDDFAFDLDESSSDDSDDFAFDLDEGSSGDDDDLEFDLGGPAESNSDVMSLDDDDIDGAIDGLVPQAPRSSQQIWSNLLDQLGSLSYALSSELRDFDNRFSNVLRNEYFLQALRELYDVGTSIVDGVFALMGFVCEAYVGKFDRSELLPGHKDALGKALLVRQGLAVLRRVVNKKNRVVQDSTLPEEERSRARDRLGASLQSFNEGEVFAVMRPGDRFELSSFFETISGSSPKETVFACEGLDKYLDSLLSVNQRDVLIKHDQDIMSEVAQILEGVAPLVYISPQGAIDMVREGFTKSQGLRGYRDDLDDLLREWQVEAHTSGLPGALLGMGDRLAAFVAPK